jgi:hypothetical protein
LLEALRLLGVQQGGRVLLPSFICRDLLAPISLLGATPLWYEVAPDLSAQDPSENWPVADVVLMINYFGFPQSVRPFALYASRTGAAIIEDNAHGYLSRAEDGCWLGCRTDIGLFSLRKTLRIPDGAALRISDRYRSYNLPAQLPFEGRGGNPAQLTKARLRSVPVAGEVLYRMSTAAVRLVRSWRTGSVVPPSDPASEQALPMGAIPWSRLPSALTTFPAAAEIKRRRMAYADFLSLAERVGATPIFPRLPDLCAPYGFPFRADNDTASVMCTYAARHGFDCVTWPELPTMIASRALEHYRNVFLVNFLW